MRDISRWSRAAIPVAAVLAIAGCASPPEFLTIDVTVTGLTSSGLQVHESVGNKDVSIAAGSSSAQIRIAKSADTDRTEVGSNDSLFQWNLSIGSQPASWAAQSPDGWSPIRTNSRMRS